MRSLPLLGLLLPLPAFADCPGEVILGCMIGEKTMEICADASAMSYSYGPKGTPELAITAPLASGPVQPWPGVGRAIWEAARFQNKDTVYEVWVSVDRMTEDASLEAGIEVLKGEQALASLTCEPATIYGNGVFALSDAMADAGFCWNFDSFQWATSCPAP